MQSAPNHPIAERIGLISAIGTWTLEEACRQIREWLDRGLVPPRVSVNLSAIQIYEENIPDKISDLLTRFRVPANLLELEIVEGVLVKDLAKTTQKLNRVRAQGVNISIDDYGTGYSSLSYVKEFPVDTLKIDRCFITEIESNAADRAIVESTILLAHSLGMEVIAEGVETQSQLNVLQQLRCDHIQGYLYSRPLNAAAFAALLRQPAARLAAV